MLLAGSLLAGGLLAAWSVRKLPVLLSVLANGGPTTTAAPEHPVRHLPTEPKGTGASRRVLHPNILIPIPTTDPPTPLPKEFPGGSEIRPRAAYRHAVPSASVGTVWDDSQNAAWRESPATLKPVEPRESSGSDGLVPVRPAPRRGPS